MVALDESEGIAMNRFAMSRRTVVGGIGASLVSGSAQNALAAPKSLADVKKAGVLQVGCEAAYVPFTYRDNTAAIVGFDVEIVTAYLQPIGVRPEFIDTQWSGVIPALYAGRFDMVPTMSYTKERLERVLFSIPYADASQALLIRAVDKDKISTISDMANRVLGVKLGSPGETLKNKLADKLTAERGAAFKDVKTYDDHPAAYLALAQGSVDGVLNTVPTLSVVLRDKRDTFSIVYNVGQDNWHGYAFRKEDTELANFINDRITDMKKSGEIYALQEKWFGFRMKLSDTIPAFG
jgi:polar amino acid transport system substrate-binding protein